ncbi:MAG: energy transducer TonB [Candidatus Binatia bacterium]
MSKLNRKDKVQKAPAIPSPDSINSKQAETKDTSDKIIVKKYNSQDKKIAKLKVFAALNEKKPKKKAFTKRSAVDPTMINVSEPATLYTGPRREVSKPNRKGKVKTVLSTPSPDPTNSSLADTGSETIVEKDNSPEAEAAVEMSAFIKDSDEADISEPDELVSETGGSEASDERFRNETPPEATIALRSRQEGDGSRVFKPAGLTRRISPKYPKRARRKGWEGTTLLRVLVDRRGKSKVIQVSQSSGFASLDGAAVKAVEQWRFYPAQNGNGPVESWVRVPIIFRLVRDQN